MKKFVLMALFALTANSGAIAHTTAPVCLQAGQAGSFTSASTFVRDGDERMYSIATNWWQARKMAKIISERTGYRPKVFRLTREGTKVGNIGVAVSASCT